MLCAMLSELALLWENARILLMSGRNLCSLGICFSQCIIIKHFWGQCGREEAALRKRGRLEVDLESNSIDLSLAESARCRVDFELTSSRLDSAATLIEGGGVSQQT
jgi:hypothetical protein